MAAAIIAAPALAESAARSQAVVPSREVSVLDFGAVSDGDSATPTNNSPAFADAIEALTTVGGGVLHIPPGTYYLAQSLQISLTGNDGDIAIQGGGSNQTKLRFPSSAGHGLIFSLASSGASPTYQSARVRDLALLTDNSAVGGSQTDPGRCAIRYVPSSPQQGSPYLTAVIQNVEIRGLNGFSHFWDTGIYLNNVVNAWIEAVEVLGKFNYHAAFQGILADRYAVNVSCSNCQVNYCTYGFRMYSNEGTALPSGTQVAGTEGLQIINCGVGGAHTGAFHDNGTSPEPRPALQVVGCNFNCTYNCVATSNVTECVVTGNVFYLQPTAFVDIAPGAACVNIVPANGGSAVSRHAIAGNIFRALSSVAAVRGIVCGGQNVAISGNSFDSFDLGIILTPTSAHCLLSGNTFANISTFQVQNAGTANSYAAASSLPSGSSVNIV